ncbi:MAG: polysaccharide biosynthesis C-terminal domain-containing protein [Gammaproteobacteria bacterium]
MARHHRPLQLLAGLAAFRSITTVLAPVVIVTGGTRLSMYTAILEALIMPFVFYTATNWGLEGVAAAWLIGYPLFSLPLYVRAFRRAEMSINRYLTSISPALNGSLIMAITVLALKLSMPADWPLAGRFALELLVGGCAYCLATWLIYRKRLLDFYYEFRKLGQEKHLLNGHSKTD